jgi:hypothetical protein
MRKIFFATIATLSLSICAHAASASLVCSAAGYLVGGIGGDVVSELCDSTPTVDDDTEMVQRDQAIQDNMADHGTPYFESGPSTSDDDL